MEPQQKPPDAAKANMANETPANIRKRILLLSVMLGMMFGVTVFVFVVAILKQKLSLLAVPLPMFVIAIPMASNLIQLRKAVKGQTTTPTV